MGAYRFILAFVVLYHHTFGYVLGRRIGVSAVICFLLLSGYVMKLLFDKYYRQPWRPAAFWLDRGLRLFPQYLFYLAVTLALIWGLGAHNSFAPDPDVRSALLAALLLPTGYYMFGMEQVLVLAPTWSLGLEASFYLLFPFFVAMPTTARFGVFVASLVIFAVAALGCINSDLFTLRLIPGTLFIFLVGSAMTGRHALPAAALAIAVGTAMVLGASLVPSLGAQPFNFEVGSGLVVGAVALFVLRARPFSRLDDMLGSLSYGVFLAHVPMIMIADLAHIERIYFVPVASITAAVLSYFAIERPVLLWRRSLRARPPQPTLVALPAAGLRSSA